MNWWDNFKRNIDIGDDPIGGWAASGAIHGVNSVFPGVGSGLAGVDDFFSLFRDNRPRLGIGGLSDSIRGFAEKTQGTIDWLDAARKAAAAAQNKKAASGDPLAGVINGLWNGGGGGVSTSGSSYRKQSQKVINDAILAARGSYDAEIADLRSGLKSALALNEKQAAKFGGANAKTGGNAKARNDAYKAEVQQRADASVAATDADTQRAMRELGLEGVGGPAADRARAAGDRAKAVVLGQAAAQQRTSDQQTTGMGQYASDAGDFVRTNAAETSQKLQRQVQRQVARLQRERAAAIAQARANAGAGLLETEAARSTAAAQSLAQNRQMALEMMRLGLDRENAAAERAMMQQRNAMDVYGLLNKIGSTGLKDKLIGGTTEKPVMGYRYPDVNQMMQIASQFGPQFASIYGQPQNPLDAIWGAK